MTTVSRTNYCTNPSCTTTTGYGVNQGGGTAALSAVGGYVRATWTVAATSVGGVNAATTLIPGTFKAGDVYTLSLTVRTSKNATVQLGGYYRTGSTSVGGGGFNLYSITAVTATRITVTLPAIAAADNMYFYCYFSTSNGGTLPGVNDYIEVDAVQAEVGTSYTGYFTGASTAHDNFAYQWTGTANASSSQEYYALPTILTVAKTDAPCPRTEVTVVGLGTGTTVFNVWRTADGTRKAVRGARNRSGVDSDFVVDYEAPLNRSLTYDIEVISGSQVTQPTYPATVTVLSSTWWIQDPLVPSSAIPLNVSKQDSNAPYLTGNAIKSLEYGASVTLIPILGSPDPVALMGTRTIAGNVTFDMFTNLASVTTQLRNLIQQTPLLLIRSTGTRNNGIPGLAYFTSAKPSEKPVTVAFGGTLTNWSLTGDLVAAPTMNVLVPIWTYGTVAALWTTYQQAQTTLAAKTYLDVLKSPAGT